MEPLLWDASVQETPPFRGHKIWSQKNVHIIFVLVNFLKSHLYLGERDTYFFWVPKPGFRGHLSTQKVTDHKNH